MSEILQNKVQLSSFWISNGYKRPVLEPIATMSQEFSSVDALNVIHHIISNHSFLLPYHDLSLIICNFSLNSSENHRDKSIKYKRGNDITAETFVVSPAWGFSLFIKWVGQVSCLCLWQVAAQLEVALYIEYLPSTVFDSSLAFLLALWSKQHKLFHYNNR